MKVEDIIVSKRYTHSYYPGCIWLGIGKRKLFTEDEWEEKHLVLIKTPDDSQCVIGAIVKEGDDAAEGHWDYFQDADSDSQLFIVQTK